MRSVQWLSDVQELGSLPVSAQPFLYALTLSSASSSPVQPFLASLVTSEGIFPEAPDFPYVSLAGMMPRAWPQPVSGEGRSRRMEFVKHVTQE